MRVLIFILFETQLCIFINNWEKTYWNAGTQVNHRTQRFNGNHSNFEELLWNDNSVYIQRNKVYGLATEIFKMVDSISTKMISENNKSRVNPQKNLGYTQQGVWNLKSGSKYPLKPKVWNPLEASTKFVNCPCKSNLCSIMLH